MKIDVFTKLFFYEYVKNNYNLEKLVFIKIIDFIVSFRCNGIYWNI